MLLTVDLGDGRIAKSHATGSEDAGDLQQTLLRSVNLLDTGLINLHYTDEEEGRCEISWATTLELIRAGSVSDELPAQVTAAGTKLMLQGTVVKGVPARSMFKKGRSQAKPGQASSLGQNADRQVPTNKQVTLHAAVNAVAQREDVSPYRVLNMRQQPAFVKPVLTYVLRMHHHFAGQTSIEDAAMSACITKFMSPCLWG